MESRLVSKNLREEIGRLGLDKEIKVIETGCFGFCNMGPIMVVYPEGTFYCQVQPQDVTVIAEEHLRQGKPVERLLYRHTKDGAGAASMEDIEFFKHQKRVALENCGRINPEDIEEYIGQNGYFALAKCLKEMSREDVIDAVKKSGVRGRGGAGFPTGMKWSFASGSKAEQKYVVCNADEGDPGAFMDRSVLEGDPHSVLEAMAIAGYAIGASHGYIYIRAEYPIAVERLRIAIRQAREYGVLGEGIFDTDFHFDVDIRLGAGAFVCGEETALLASTEGRRGEPRPRPPYPAVQGLFGRPTVINNVETLANIPKIIFRGWEWFAAMGTEKSKGTKVFALAGKINNIGLIEIPMGTTLRTIIYDIGGGIPKGKKFKAAQTGGPSGGCLTETHLDIPLDYDNLAAAGSMMGSGGLIVMDEDNCMVDIARFFLEFTQDESCGKCPPCRIGTKRMLEILNKITSGNGVMEDLDRLEVLAETIRDSSLCALGQTAPNPVLSTLKHFRSEYEAHIREKKCPAGVCQALLSYTIDPLKCKGCSLCARNCPAGAISGKIKEPYVIDQAKCVKCGECISRCKFGAISKG
jgi:NADP-reducing hydrogenase subunit HndC